jgi:EmrB/QacA subfamily drug resistance transporter
MAPKWWVLASVACGTFMATLDASIVNIALPTLTKALGTDIARIQWVVSSYLLTITCLLLPFGRLSDTHGRKRVFQLGFLVFTIGSLLCGIAPNLMFLLASRVLQGVGASMLMANGPAIITANFPASERGKALGIMAMVTSAGLVSGPSIGGFLIDQLGWPSIFLINVPIGVIGIWMVQRNIPFDRLTRTPMPFDWVGAFLQMIILVLFTLTVNPLSISISGSVPFTVSRIIVLGVTALFAAVFLKVESEARAPIFDTSLMRNQVFWTANLAAFFTFVAYSSVTVLMPFFLEEVLKLRTRQAGIFMTAIPLTILFVAPVSGRMSDRLGSRGLSMAGALVGALGLFLMAGALGTGVDEHAHRAGIILGLCSIGLATGLFQSPNNNAIMSAVPLPKLGAASALLATVRNLGLATGVGLSTQLFEWRRETSDFVSALHFTFAIAGAVAVCAVLVSAARRTGKPAAKKAPVHGLEA